MDQFVERNVVFGPEHPNLSEWRRTWREFAPRLFGMPYEPDYRCNTYRRHPAYQHGYYFDCGAMCLCSGPQWAEAWVAGGRHIAKIWVPERFLRTGASMGEYLWRIEEFH